MSTSSRAVAPAPGFTATDLGLVVMAVIWGVNYSVVKHGLRHIPPLTFNGLRVALAAVVLAGVAATVRDAPWPPRRDLVRLAALGLLGNGIYQLFFIAGLARTRAGVAALLVAAGPAWIALVSRLAGQERLPLRGWGGIALQLVGVGFVVASARGLEADGAVLAGALLITCGSISWAVFSVLLQPYTTRAHPLHLAAITMASGALFLFTLALPGILALDWRAVAPSEWGSVAYAGIGALVVAYLLFYRGVRVLGATRTAMYSNLQPFIAMLVAWALLGEHPTWPQWAGAACIIAGVMLTRLAATRRPARLATR